jgi:hypothetical protein
MELMTAFRRTKLGAGRAYILAIVLKIDYIALLWVSSLPYLFDPFDHTFISFLNIVLISSSLQGDCATRYYEGFALSHETGAVVGRAPTTRSSGLGRP